MGSSASKAARGAPRKYPTQPDLSQSKIRKPSSRPPTDPPRGPAVHPRPGFSNTRDASINADAADPDFVRPPNAAFSSRLRQLGAVQPSPTLSHSAYPPANGSAIQANASKPSRINPALLVLQSRGQLAREAEEEFEEVARLGTQRSRRFLDVASVRTVLSMRDEEGKGAGEIERALGLERGVVARLGKGVVSGAGAAVEKPAA